MASAASACAAPAKRFVRGDVAAGGRVDLADAVGSLSFQFQAGPAPRSPFPDCGIDPFLDALDCKAYPGCR